jgi:hypothetical protein
MLHNPASPTNAIPVQKNAEVTDLSLKTGCAYTRRFLNREITKAILKARRLTSAGPALRELYSAKALLEEKSLRHLSSSRLNRVAIDCYEAACRLEEEPREQSIKRLLEHARELHAYLLDKVLERSKHPAFILRRHFRSDIIGLMAFCEYKTSCPTTELTPKIWQAVLRVLADQANASSLRFPEPLHLKGVELWRVLAGLNSLEGRLTAETRELVPAEQKLGAAARWGYAASLYIKCASRHGQHFFDSFDSDQHRSVLKGAWRLTDALHQALSDRRELSNCARALLHALIRLESALCCGASAERIGNLAASFNLRRLALISLVRHSRRWWGALTALGFENTIPTASALLLQGQRHDWQRQRRDLRSLMLLLRHGGSDQTQNAPVRSADIQNQIDALRECYHAVRQAWQNNQPLEICVHSYLCARNCLIETAAAQTPTCAQLVSKVLTTLIPGVPELITLHLPYQYLMGRIRPDPLDQALDLTTETFKPSASLTRLQSAADEIASELEKLLPTLRLLHEFEQDDNPIKIGYDQLRRIRDSS